MNGFTLDADGPRWWLAPALAAAAATLAATAIVAYPTSAQTPSSPREAPAAYVELEGPPVTPTTDGTGNCFFYRARWNLPLDGARPVCNWHGSPGRR